MGLEALAAGLVITVKDKTARGVASIGRGFKRLKNKGQQLGSAMSALAPVAGQLAIAGAAVGLVLGLGAKKAIDFEKQLSAVLAVTSSASAKEFPALTAEIKRLGATTQFSATEAAQGAENLTRAGFSASEVIVGLSGALNAAAADGIDMATSARLIANNVRAFALEATDANRVADILANTSAKSNTNMVELGEGLKFVAPISRELGVSLEDTSAALGVLADAGLQGTVGGNALKNMFLKIAKPSAAGAKLIEKYGIKTFTAADGSLNLAKTMDDLAVKMGKIPSKLERVAVAQEIFGIRGGAAMSNFVAVVEKSGKSLKDRFGEIQADTEGAAERMAAIRLDNVAGSFTLLGSALEGLAIEVFSGNLTVTKDAVRFLADALSVVVETLQQAKDGFIIDSKAMEKFRAKFGPLTDTLIAFGLGISKGLGILQAGIKIVANFAKSVAENFGEGSDMAEGFGTFVVLATPVILVLGVIGAAALAIAIPLITMGTAIVAVLKVVGVALVGIVLGMGLFFGAVNSSRREGQSFGDAMIEVFQKVKTFALDYFKGFMEGYNEFIKPSFDLMIEAGGEMLAALKPLFDIISDAFGEMGGEGQSFGKTVAMVFGFVIKVISVFVKVIAFVLKFFVDNFLTGMLSGIADILGGFWDLVTGATSVKDALFRIFGGLAKVFANILLVPIRSAIDLAIKAAKLLGQGDTEVVKKAESALAVLQFKEGFTKAGRTGATLTTGSKQPGRTGAGALNKPTIAKIKGAGTPEINITNKPGDSKFDIKNEVCVDGREMAAATGRAKVENLERLGGVQTPFFNRAVRGGGNTAAPSGR